MSGGRRTRRVLVILGGRSGTSALAGGLGLLGATLPRNLMGASPANPKGHFEPQRIADFHDDLLGGLGLTWFDPRPVPDSWFASREAAGAGERARTLFSEEYGDARTAILKEPRIARFLPMWHDVFDQLSVSATHVFVRRHPFEVASSIRKRDGSQLDTGYCFYLRGTLSAERDSRSRRRIIIDFDEFLRDWRASLAGLRSSIDPDGTFPSPEQQNALDHFVSPELKHEFAAGRADPSDARFAALATRVDDVLRAGFDAPESTRALDEARTAFDALIEDLFPPVAHHCRATEGRDSP